MNTFYNGLGLFGALLCLPMVVAMMQTGRGRLFPRASAVFEQRLIDWWNMFLSMAFVGHILWIIGAFNSTDAPPMWLVVALCFLNGVIIGNLMGTRSGLQEYLNGRLANEAGNFFCERCEFFHNVRNAHVA